MIAVGDLYTQGFRLFVEQSLIGRQLTPGSEIDELADAADQQPAQTGSPGCSPASKISGITQYELSIGLLIRRLDSLSFASLAAQNRGQTIAAGRTYQSEEKFGTPKETIWRIFV